MLDYWIQIKDLPEYTGLSKISCVRLLQHTKGLKIKVANAKKQRTIKLVLKSSLDSADWQTTP